MNKKIIFSALFLLLFFSCSSVRVLETKAEEGFNLSDYQTFDFYTPASEGDQVLQEYQREMDLLKEEISQALENMGLSRSTDPDLLVNIGAVVEEKADTRQTNIREAPRYIGQRRYSWKSEEIVVRTYKMGTVTIDLVDPAENELVWRGVAEGVVPEDEEKLRNTIEKGIQKLFSELPSTENEEASE